MNALQFYDQLHADPATQGIPVIVITADSHPQGLEERGLGNFIVKPFDIDELLDRVASVVPPKQREP